MCHLFFFLCRLENRRRYGNVDTKKIHLAAFDQDSVVTVDADGRIRQWEVNQSRLAKSLDLWRTTIGGKPYHALIKETELKCNLLIYRRWREFNDRANSEWRRIFA